MLAVHSQHIHAEVTGWRTPKGLLLREPAKGSFTFTPALAKCATCSGLCAQCCLVSCCVLVLHALC